MHMKKNANNPNGLKRFKSLPVMLIDSTNPALHMLQSSFLCFVIVVTSARARVFFTFLKRSYIVRLEINNSCEL